MLRAGTNGTKGTLNRSPVVFWWWATIATIPEKKTNVVSHFFTFFFENWPHIESH